MNYEQKIYRAVRYGNFTQKKKYNNKVDYYYLPNGEICLAVITEVSNDTLDYENNGTVAAPTYHEVIDWLYGKKICITCHVAYSYEEQYNGFRYEIQSYNEDDYPDDIYRTRENALNAAILKALEML